MRPPVIALLVALALAALLIGSELLRDFAASRERLTTDQRRREDRERARLASEAERNLWIDMVATTFDPIGLFH